MEIIICVTNVFSLCVPKVNLTQSLGDMYK